MTMPAMRAAVPEAEVQGAVMLSAQNLCKRFGGLVAVSDLSFDLRANEILGLIGPNGAGKTTTFNLLSGFLKPTSGSLAFQGRDVTNASPTKISRQGLVRTFQHGSLMKPMTVYDNILIGTLQGTKGNAHRDARIREIAALLKIGDKLDVVAGILPHGVQRLLSIGIAVASNPTLLCLDEPLTGLNPTEIGSVVEIIRRLRTEWGITILIIDHNMRAVMQLCDRIVVLSYGRKLAEGCPAEIRSNQAVIEAYLGEAE